MIPSTKVLALITVDKWKVAIVQIRSVNSEQIKMKIQNNPIYLIKKLGLELTLWIP